MWKRERESVEERERERQRENENERYRGEWYHRMFDFFRSNFGFLPVDSRLLRKDDFRDNLKR